MENSSLKKFTTLCVVCGLVALALFGAATMLDSKREWKDYQNEYREMLLKKITRSSNPAFYDRVSTMKPEIRQVVVGEWKEVERCPTCHLGIDDPLFANAKQPFRTHPNLELLKKHPTDKFGCTICHGGQGLATTVEGAAHRTIADWPVPMVTKGLMQSRCGICHKDFEAIGADRLVTGREIFKEMHCAGCHQIDKQGGAVGPDLSAFADKDPGSFDYTNVVGGHAKQAWVVEHFKNPKKVTPGSPMQLPALNDEQIDCLASYVLSLSQREFTRQYTARVKADFIPPRVDTIMPETDLSMPAEDAKRDE